MAAAPSRLHELLLAEALRLRGARQPLPADAPETLRLAAKAASPEARLLAWSALQAGSQPLRDANATALRLLLQLGGLAMLMTALTAGGSLSLLLGGDGPINVSALLAGSLVWPLAMLVLWALLRLRPASAPDGGWLQALLAKLLRRLAPGTAALLALLARGAFGVWARSLLLHLLWAGAFVGMIAACAFRFTFQQYDFLLQTTLLTAPNLDAVQQALGLLPSLLGWPPPASDLPPDAARRAWGLFVIACLIAYGLLPRLLAAALSALLARRVLGRPMLDLSQPFWVDLLLRIGRAAVVATPQGAPAPAQVARPAAPASGPDERPVGRHVAIVRLEPEAVSETRATSDFWPALDLGSIAGRDDLRRVAADLAAMSARPARLLVVASLLRTPDRGAVAGLQALSAAAAAPLTVLLADRKACTQRGSDAALREADWHRHAADASAEQVRIGELAALLQRPLPELGE